MKALTIWQPWASLIVENLKLFEFRRYPAPRSLVGQRFVIHAGKSRIGDEEWRELIDDDERLAGSTGLLEDRLNTAHNFLTFNFGALPLGVGLGTAVLGEPRRALDLFAGRIDREDIDPDMWGWPLSDAQRWADPIPAAGAQGFWNWDSGEAVADGHLCPAHGCEAIVPQAMLMCLRHWRLVPRALQREVYRTYRPGQERGGRLGADYVMAVRHAVKAVAERERQAGKSLPLL